MMWDYDSHMSGWAWAFMGVGMILFWTAVVVGIIAVLRYFGDSNRRSQQPELTAAEILARRFARGEITEDEFRTKVDLVKH